MNMGLAGIRRIEEFVRVAGGNESAPNYDPMLQRVYEGLDSNPYSTSKRKPPR